MFEFQLSWLFLSQMYADKETFLTSAYRQKLEERKKMEEELRREEEAESESAVFVFSS